MRCALEELLCRHEQHTTRYVADRIKRNEVVDASKDNRRALLEQAGELMRGRARQLRAKQLQVGTFWHSIRSVLLSQQLFHLFPSE